MVKVQLKNHPFHCFVMAFFAFDFDLVLMKNHSLLKPRIALHL